MRPSVQITAANMYADPAEAPKEPNLTPMVPENVQMFSSTDVSIDAAPRSTPLDDIESTVALYRGRIYRFLLGTLRDHDHHIHGHHGVRRHGAHPPALFRA